MKVVCLHPRLGVYTSHDYNEAQGFINEYRRRGTEFVLLSHVHALPSIVRELGARPVIDDPTYRLEWSFDERSDRFLRILHKQVDRLITRDDVVMITVATQVEALALVRWLQDLPERKKPWVVIFFTSDRWNRAGREEYEKAMAQFAKVRAAIAGLSTADANRVIFSTLTELLREELTEILGAPVSFAPMPLEYGDPAAYPPAPRTSPRPLVAMLGGTRREKGSHRIPEIVRACPSVDFLIHLTNNSLTPEELLQLAPVANEPNVTVIDRPMTLPEYNVALSGCDLALFPYEPVNYRKRTSGVFGEAVAYGKPVVVSPGTWMAEQIEGGRAAGVIAEDLRSESFARAIAECVARLDELRALAAPAAQAWRKTVTLSVFVDRIEEQIAARARNVLPPRKRRFWFW